MMMTQTIEKHVRARRARRTAKPHLIYAYAVRSSYFWRGVPGELTLARTEPFQRAQGRIRVVAEPLVQMGGKRGGTWVLRPLEVNEEGWLTLRLPRQMARGLYLWRLCVGHATSNPALFFVA